MSAAGHLPLDGVLVVERAGRLAGGVCALLLHELGAQVLRFEAPGAPLPLALEGQAADNLAALLRIGRTRVRHDPDTFARMEARADVTIVAPLDPAAPELAALRRHSERTERTEHTAHAEPLIRCVITPYGLAAPAGGLPVHGDELTLQAVSGLMGTTGALDGPPMPNGVPMAELIGGVNAAVAVLAALRVRDRDGGGQLLDIALFDGLLATMGSFLPLALDGASQRLRQGCRHPLTAPWNVYPTADGRVVICTTTDPQWRQLLALAGREDALADPRFASAGQRVRHVEAVDALVGAWTATQSSEPLIAALTEVGVAAGAMRAIPALTRDPELCAQGLIRQVRDDAGHRCYVAGPPVSFNGAAPAAGPAAVPPLLERVPDELLRRPAPIARPATGGGNASPELPLAGVRVLESTLYTAGPLAARNLASLGAEVIKVEALGGEPCRGWTPAVDGASLFFANNNSDKRALALDLKADAGRRVFRQLAERCDVVLENLRPGALERLGLGYEALCETNPTLAYCSISGYGRHSAYAGKSAYDTVIQAESGLMSLLSGEGAIKVGVSIADLMGAAFAPLAVLAALRARERDGRGRHIDLSMRACTAWLTQLAWPDGQAALPPWQRLAAADGYVLAGDAPERVEAALAGADPRALACAALVARLAAAGVRAVRIAELAEVLAGDHVARRGLLRRVDNRLGHPVPLLAPAYRLARTPARLARPIGAMGAETGAILAELGYTPAETAALRERGAVG